MREGEKRSKDDIGLKVYGGMLCVMLKFGSGLKDMDTFGKSDPCALAPDRCPPTPDACCILHRAIPSPRPSSPPPPPPVDLAAASLVSLLLCREASATRGGSIV